MPAEATYTPVPTYCRHVVGWHVARHMVLYKLTWLCPVGVTCQDFECHNISRDICLVEFWWLGIDVTTCHMTCRRHVADMSSRRGFRASKQYVFRGHYTLSVHAIIFFVGYLFSNNHRPIIWRNWSPDTLLHEINQYFLLPPPIYKSLPNFN